MFELVARTLHLTMIDELISQDLSHKINSLQFKTSYKQASPPASYSKPHYIAQTHYMGIKTCCTPPYATIYHQRPQLSQDCGGRSRGTRHHQSHILLFSFDSQTLHDRCHNWYQRANQKQRDDLRAYCPHGSRASMGPQHGLGGGMVFVDRSVSHQPKPVLNRSRGEPDTQTRPECRGLEAILEFAYASIKNSFYIFLK